MRLRVSLLAITAAWTLPTVAAQELPFDTANQSPLVQIYGLPAIGAAYVLAPGQFRADLHLDTANHLIVKERATESLYLDGETHRATLKVYRGWGHGREMGIEIPYVGYNGGFLDSFIENWHDFFGLPQNGRDRMPSNQLLFRYRRDGIDQINLTRPATGIGDVRLIAAQSLATTNSVADTTARIGFKLPTGDGARLLGSDGADVALWLSSACRHTKCSGAISWYGGGGVMWIGKGNVLPDLQRQWVAFGTAGLHWRALPRITLALQFDGHTPFYRDSGLKPISDSSVQLVLGGMWRLHDRHMLELAVSEDIVVDTAPDVALRIGLRSWF